MNHSGLSGPNDVIINLKLLVRGCSSSAVSTFDQLMMDSASVVL